MALGSPKRMPRTGARLYLTTDVSMRMPTARELSPLGALILLLACDTQRDGIIVEPRLNSFANSGWSTPLNIGPVVNSRFGDNNATLAPDGLALYFASDRPGGLGLADLWVARRASLDSSWEPPVNLGAPVNTPFGDGAPALSIDGHLLFLHSNRPGGQRGNDIWVARRSGSTDEDTWEAPVPVGLGVNTAGDEQGPDYVSSGGGLLYFNRGTQALGQSDLYVANVGRDGRTSGNAVPITELNASTANDAAPTLRTDGREIVFWSARAGGLGVTDMWVSTRQSADGSWSPPENLGAPLNWSGTDLHPDLSRDGRTLLFSSDRPGGFGITDIWMSTRTPSGN